MWAWYYDWRIAFFCVFAYFDGYRITDTKSHFWCELTRFSKVHGLEFVQIIGKNSILTCQNVHSTELYNVTNELSGFQCKWQLYNVNNNYEYDSSRNRK